MEETDRISALRASLELMIQENTNLLKHFEQLVKELDILEQLAPADRHAKFREIEARGAFNLHGIDIRHFARASQKQLLPAQFLRRTQRRLVNTVNMVREFRKRGVFEQGDMLIGSINKVTENIVDEANPREVMAFRDRVDEIRHSPGFEEYLHLKQQLIWRLIWLRSLQGLLRITQYGQLIVSCLMMV